MHLDYELLFWAAIVFSGAGSEQEQMEQHYQLVYHAIIQAFGLQVRKRHW